MGPDEHCQRICRRQAHTARSVGTGFPFEGSACHCVNGVTRGDACALPVLIFSLFCMFPFSYFTPSVSLLLSLSSQHPPHHSNDHDISSPESFANCRFPPRVSPNLVSSPPMTLQPPKKKHRPHFRSVSPLHARLSLSLSRDLSLVPVSPLSLPLSLCTFSFKRKWQKSEGRRSRSLWPGSRPWRRQFRFRRVPRSGPWPRRPCH